MQGTSRSWSPFVVAVAMVLPGCAAGQADRMKGESGPIAWEATDIRQTVEDQGNRMRWNYTLVLRNLGPTAVTFDQVTLIATTPSGNMSGGHSTRPYSRRLEPGAEARELNNSYSHWCAPSCDPQSAQQMLRTGVTRIIQLRGTDTTGRRITPTIRLRLNSSIGMRPTKVQELASIAGKWHGIIYGVSAGQATVTIEPDGRYTWVAPRESGSGMVHASGDGRVLFESSAGRKGAATLYESGGRRVLAVTYEGLNWEGVLTPAE